jgi:hypothetical protein
LEHGKLREEPREKRFPLENHEHKPINKKSEFFFCKPHLINKKKKLKKMGFGLGSITGGASSALSGSTPFSGSNPFSGFDVPNPFAEVSGLIEGTLGTILSPLTNLIKGLGAILPTLLIGGAVIGGIMILKK